MTARLLPSQSSAAALSADGGLRRQLRQPNRPRPAEFMAAFDDRSLFYDCFWHHQGGRVLLVGPAPFNLMPWLRAAEFVAMPSRARLRQRLHASISVMVTDLGDVPADSTAIGVTIAGQQFELPIQPNSAGALAGARVLFSMNKDNELAWIAEWARYHAAIHGTDTVILFDNGSSRYGPEAVAATLSSVPGIAHVAVPSWPQPFGAFDPAITANPYWSHFLQIASMSVVLRRYGRAARGLLNCDIDELACPGAGSIYETAEGSPGFFTFKGQWVEACAEHVDGGTATHRSFTRRLADTDSRQCRDSKWVIDPKRRWLDRLSVHPYWHWIANRPLFAKRRLSGAFYWHFKGISTNWKTARTTPVAAELTEPDTALAAAFARIAPP